MVLPRSGSRNQNRIRKDLVYLLQHVLVTNPIPLDVVVSLRQQRGAIKGSDVASVFVDAV